MFGKKLLWLVMALAILSSTGCCRMWEHWCAGRHHYQPAPYCQPCPQPCPPGCAPTPAFSSPTPTPVPNAPGWQRNCP
ncbi:MAG: hypothetical protein FJ303_17590 [Planctomycetes bacterium]|nr:hypothetical protein [Planctomycetota bacterium]